jgi:hypothetical protein
MRKQTSSTAVGIIAAGSGDGEHKLKLSVMGDKYDLEVTLKNGILDGV